MAPTSSTVADRLQGLRRLEGAAQRWIIGLMRIVVGLLWLANIEWKRPSDFGLDLKNGLWKYIDSGVRNPVFGPYSWFLENVVLKQYRLFGWITLLLECALAIALILGLFTRTAALVGAGQSVAIALSVLYYDKVYEWPWSYYLMFAVHLFVFATASAGHLSFDGIRSAGLAVQARAATVCGSVAVVIGLLGLYVSRGIDVTAKQGRMVGWAKGELKFLWFNPLAAALTVVLGLVAVVAGLGLVRGARHLLLWVSAGGFALMALQVLVQWRYNRGRWTGGILGATGPNIAFWGGLAVALAIVARRLRRPV